MDETNAIFRITGPGLDKDHVVVPRTGIYAGRTANNELVLAHTQISRQHMRLFWQDGGFWVEDLGSTNGVWVNDARIDAHTPRRVDLGDNVGAGPFVLTLESIEEGLGTGSNGHRTPPPVPSHNSPTTFIQEFSMSPGVVEAAPINLRPRSGGERLSIGSVMQAMIPRTKVRDKELLAGIPRDQSNWLQYLPGIYSDSDLDPTLFMGRYLLIFESVLSPIIWMIDNFDLYLSPETAPEVWLQWIGNWFDVLLVPELPVELQREIIRQMGWLFLRRGTRVGLERLLELYFGVKPEIFESNDDSCHFAVRLPLSQSKPKLGREIAEYIIESQKPAFTTYTLEID